MQKDDVIYRQAAIDALAEQIALCDKALNTFGISMKDEYAVKVEKASLVAYKEQLEFIPAAQPEWKKGKWVGYDGDWLKTMCKCSECGAMIDVNEKYRNFFCYHCGARMDGGQGGEENR